MKRTVELYIHKGVITELAPLPPVPGSKKQKDQDPNSLYGQIHVSNLAGPKGKDSAAEVFLTVYTHIKHSFRNPAEDLKNGGNDQLKNEKIKQPYNDDFQQPNIGDEVFFFLVPMEYLFSKLPGSIDAAPMLAVNVNPVFPFLEKVPDTLDNRHPCTTLTTIQSDTFPYTQTLPIPPLIPISASIILLILGIIFIPIFIRNISLRKKRYYYGINDYGELTIIVTDKNRKLEAWDKILLKPWIHPRTEHFKRSYSPKLEKPSKIEFKILIQNIHEPDKWYWAK